MFRVTVKVRTAKAAAVLSVKLRACNVATSDLGGGWHSVSFLHKLGAAYAHKWVIDHNPGMVFASRVLEVPLPDGVGMASYEVPAKPVALDVLGALQKLHTAILMCDSVGIAVTAGHSNAMEPVVQIIDRMADSYLYDGTDHGSQHYLNPAVVELAMIQHNKARSQ